jgi:phytoene dehydrogenase-like protein
MIMDIKHYDVVIVGAGMAGLTAAAYLSLNHNVAIIEKDSASGGLLGSFQVDGHFLDKGARGIIDSGIIFPMLKQLNLHVDFVDNPIKMMIGSEAVDLIDRDSLDLYEKMLVKFFPEEKANIALIMRDIKKVMGYMDVLYGIENPLFLPKPYSMEYLSKTLLPWMIKFVPNMAKAMKMLDPVDEHLRKYTQNESLISMIMQHFFEKTPAFFGLSYFTLYMQYHYPKGGTQTMVDVLVNHIKAHGGVFYNSTEVNQVNPHLKEISTKQGQLFQYNECLWAADTTLLYKLLVDKEKLSPQVQTKIKTQEALIHRKKGADSILSLYLILNTPPSSFKSLFGPHSFFTPDLNGLHDHSIQLIRESNGELSKDKEKVFDWITKLLKLNTFEISIPSLRDASLSPEHESTLIISTLFDYHLTKHVADQGWYEDFKENVTQVIIDIFSNSILDLHSLVKKSLVASPLTIVGRTNNHEGSVTGWSFANKPFPAIFEFLKVSKSVKTPIPHITQAGQWTFNPAGVPVAVLTGKLAADDVETKLRKGLR